MLVEKFLKYLKGYVIFKAQGIMQEELIGKCSEEKIPLKNIKLEEMGFTAQTSIENYKKISRAAANLGMRTKVIKKYGFGFWTFKHRKRYGIIAGAVMFIFVFSFLSGRLWNIDIKGANLISEEEILKKLSENGVYIGMKIKNPDGIDVINLERTLVCNIPDASCVVLNFKGSNLEVIVNEIHHEKFIIDDETKKYNVIALESGQITDMTVYDGVATVEKGQAVQKGDLLISGVVDGKKGKLHFKNASGEVKAIVEDTIEMQIDFDQTDYVKSDKEFIINFIKIGNKKISLTFKKLPSYPYNHSENSRKLLFFGHSMPISIGVDSYCCLEEVPIKLTREEAKNICLKDLENEEINRFRNCKIIDRQIVSKVKVNSYHIVCKYLIEKNIGGKREYFVENSEQNLN